MTLNALSALRKCPRWYQVSFFTGMMLASGNASATPPSSGSIGINLVPRNVSYWEMFSGATPIVKLVILLLLIASIATWTIWFSKLVELRSARQRLSTDMTTLANATSCAQAGALSHGILAEMLQIAHAETARAGKIQTASAAEGLKDRVVARLVNIESKALEHTMRGTNVLATVGAIAPFVGLFGTVWGIMNSFIGISQSHTTSLAVVAPGIAEALLATAMGLVAAIPAVIMYNNVVRGVAGFRRQLAEVATNVACLLSHDVDMQLGRGLVIQAAA